MVDLNKRSLLIATGSLVGAGSVGYEFLGSDEGGSGSGRSAETEPEVSSKITVLGYEGSEMRVSVENTGDTVLDDTLEVVSDAGDEVSREYQLKPGTTTFMSLDIAGWDSYDDVVVRDSHDSANADTAFMNIPEVTLLKQPDLDTTTDGWDPTNGNSDDWRVVKYYTKGGEVLEAPLGDIDAFAVGGGGGGGGEGCGGGGYTTTETGVQGTLDVTIGSGGPENGDDGATEIVHMNGDVRAGGGGAGGSNAGGDGGSGGGGGNSGLPGVYGAGGEDGSDGGDGDGIKGGEGQGSTTRAFAESVWELYAGGGDNHGSGSRGGGGGINGDRNGTDGLGGGGAPQGGGGDGAVLFRWPKGLEVVEEF